MPGAVPLPYPPADTAGLVGYGTLLLLLPAALDSIAGMLDTGTETSVVLLGAAAGVSIETELDVVVGTSAAEVTTGAGVVVVVSSTALLALLALLL
jgi:hypothetical protein